MIKIPRLFQNRCGVFYFRVMTATSDRRISLRTQCPQWAAGEAAREDLSIQCRTDVGIGTATCMTCVI